MEAHWIAKTEKSTSSSVKCQGFAHCFLWLSWRSASGVLTTRSYGKAIRKKRPKLWKNNSWLLHQDNASAHSSLLVRNFLAKNNTVIMPQPPYSPNLDPCDFFLFPRLKGHMKGRRFATIDEIKTKSLREIKNIPKSACQKCFEDWKKRWHKCIISEGDYFEGDNIEIHE